MESQIAPEYFPGDRVGNAAINSMVKPNADAAIVFDIEEGDNNSNGTVYGSSKTVRKEGDIGGDSEVALPMISGVIPKGFFADEEDGEKQEEEEKEDFGMFNEDFEGQLLDFLDEPSIYTVAWAAQLNFLKPKSWPTLLLLFITFLCQVFVPGVILYNMTEGQQFSIENYCPGPYTTYETIVDDDKAYGVSGTIGGFLHLSRDITPTPAPTTASHQRVPAPAPAPGPAARHLENGENLARQTHQDNYAGELWHAEFHVDNNKKDDDEYSEDDATIQSYYERNFEPEFNETKIVIIFEKITSLILSLFLLASLISTLVELKFFLVLNHISKSKWNGIHTFAFFSQYLSLILTLLCTQVLFIDSPSIRDQLLNCAALGFVVEVDNCFSVIFSHTLYIPTLPAVRVRCDKTLSHIKENFERLKERDELRKAYASKSFWKLYKVHKVLAVYENVALHMLLFIGVAMSFVATICIPNNQQFPNLFSLDQFKNEGPGSGGPPGGRN